MQGAVAAGMCPILIYRSSRQASHVLQDFHPDGQIVAIHKNAQPACRASICALPETDHVVVIRPSELLRRPRIRA